MRGGWPGSADGRSVTSGRGRAGAWRGSRAVPALSVPGSGAPWLAGCLVWRRGRDHGQRVSLARLFLGLVAVGVIAREAGRPRAQGTARSWARCCPRRWRSWRRPARPPRSARPWSPRWRPGRAPSPRVPQSGCHTMSRGACFWVGLSAHTARACTLWACAQSGKRGGTRGTQTGTHAPLRHCQRQLATLRELINSDERGCHGTGLLAASMRGPCMQHARSGTGSSLYPRDSMLQEGGRV